jgi:hypothetical protein
MTPPPSSASAVPAACGVASHALVEVRLSEIAALRDRPSPAGGPALPPRVLRHADEHTVVGLRAVLEAISSHPRPESFTGYGVVAASCQAGRIMSARSLALLKLRGPVSMSPHVIPQCSLHSLAGAVSVGLGMHGPNIGTGGGPDALAEGLVAALSMMHAATVSGDERITGVWLVVTEWDEEPILDTAGDTAADPLCRALAVALEPNAGAAVSLMIHSPPNEDRAPAATDPRGDLVAFSRALTMCAEGAALVSWSVACPWGAEVRVVRGAAAASRPAAGGIFTQREAA